MAVDAPTTKPAYAITTILGSVPYIIDTDRPFLQRPRLVLLDDFLYKDSYYHKGGQLPLKDFVAAGTDVLLGTRGERPAVLSSKRGNFKVTPEMYRETVERMGVAAFSDYHTGRLEYGGAELLEPSDAADLAAKIAQGHLLFGTRFINQLTETGQLLLIEDGALIVKHVNDTEHEYVKYMLSIKEMNAFSFISEQNYRTIDEYFRSL
ncbi:hypothetical protein PAPHI01_2302 [Pancytospora philotis]|nr:hypothetical protein PAPHI01_2302 [Pancytospora philotis]